jgi:hypothetical protein
MNAYKDIKDAPTDHKNSAYRDIPTKQKADYRPPEQRSNSVVRDCPNPCADPRSIIK